MFLSESCFRIIPRVIFFSSIPYHYKTLMRSPGSFSYIKQGNIPFPSARAMEHKVLQRFYCFRKSFAPGYQRIQTELMFFSSSSWRVSLNNYFQIPGPQCNLFKDNIADVFTQRIEFSVFCTKARSHLQNTA